MRIPRWAMGLLTLTCLATAAGLAMSTKNRIDRCFLRASFYGAKADFYHKQSDAFDSRIQELVRDGVDGTPPLASLGTLRECSERSRYLAEQYEGIRDQFSSWSAYLPFLPMPSEPEAESSTDAAPNPAPPARQPKLPDPS